MALISVSITSDALLTCMIHALSTEREEVMGLLIGNSNDDGECRIYTVFPMPRSDKRRDRVEVSEDNLISASAQCEKLSAELQMPLRVVGWFHSHPHITVWPSHVDLRTQAMYQLLDPNYVGLIISTFNTDKLTKANRLELVAFQSLRCNGPGSNEYDRMEIPVYISPQVIAFDSLSQRERSSTKLDNHHGKVANGARLGDSDASAMLLKETERSVAYSFADTSVGVSLSPTCLVALCEVGALFSNEEAAAFAKANGSSQNATASSLGNSQNLLDDFGTSTSNNDGERQSGDVLARIYNSSVYNAFMSQLLDTFEMPLVAALRSQRATLTAECDQLERRRDRLRREVENLRRQRADDVHLTTSANAHRDREPNVSALSSGKTSLYR